MALVLDASVGGVASNSYETVAEAQAYFDARLPVAGWDDADSQAVLLVMGTRILDALAQPFKTFMPGTPPYYRVRRQWTGVPATTTQRLAWPRVGMLDANGNALNYGITNATVAAASVVTTSSPHHFVTGQKVLISGSNTTPTIDGERVVTVLSAITFSVAVNVTIAGTTGSIYIIPQALKDALAELAGQLGNADRTLDNDVVIQGLTSVKAGSVSLSFKEGIVPQVIPDAVYNLMPPSWLTDELYVPANAAQFDVVSEASPWWPGERVP